jgi:hypothetical protein
VSFITLSRVVLYSCEVYIDHPEQFKDERDLPRGLKGTEPIESVLIVYVLSDKVFALTSRG